MAVVSISCEVSMIKFQTYTPFQGENARQVAAIVNGVYGADTVTANYVRFWFRRFRSGIFDVKDAPRTGRSVVENFNKTTEIIKIDRHVSSRSITQELTINHKRVLNHLCKVVFKNTKKHDGSNFHLQSLGQTE
ncbi:histone-lysine N-methyltransferase SETMAR [Trichonephila clavipes]|nr:histone-lysine N-methyltransferase SETMAR [Trichonephila clavipes]